MDSADVVRSESFGFFVENEKRANWRAIGHVKFWRVGGSMSASYRARVLCSLCSLCSRCSLCSFVAAAVCSISVTSLPDGAPSRVEPRFSREPRPSFVSRVIPSRRERPTSAAGAVETIERDFFSQGEMLESLDSIATRFATN